MSRSACTTCKPTTALARDGAQRALSPFDPRGPRHSRESGNLPFAPARPVSDRLDPLWRRPAPGGAVMENIILTLSLLSVVMVMATCSKVMAACSKTAGWFSRVMRERREFNARYPQKGEAWFLCAAQTLRREKMRYGASEGVTPTGRRIAVRDLHRMSTVTRRYASLAEGLADQRPLQPDEPTEVMGLFYDADPGEFAQPVEWGGHHRLARHSAARLQYPLPPPAMRSGRTSDGRATRGRSDPRAGEADGGGRLR